MVQVISRYVVNAPILAGEQIGLLIFAWFVCMGAILGFANGDLIKMDIISSQFPEKVRRFIGLAFDVIMVAICLFLIPSSVKLITSLVPIDIIGFPVSMAWMYSASTFGTVFFAVIGIIRIVSALRGMSRRKEDNDAFE
jgi:TRAP-type C4-dicarboxylate transport system permease small subunit